MKKVIFFIGMLISFVLVNPIHAQSPFNYFLILGSPSSPVIQGDSMEARHHNWIDVLSFKEGITQPSGARVATGGASAARAQFADLTITKRMDRASVMLKKFCASGQHIPQGVLSCALKGGSQQEIYNIKLTDVLVTGVRFSADHLGALEEVTLSYSKIEWQYNQTGPDGKPLGPIKGGYDLKAVKTF